MKLSGQRTPGVVANSRPEGPRIPGVFRPRAILCLLVLLLRPAFAAPASPEADEFSLRQKQQAQQKARAIAKELIAGILDVQLQQLCENGLEELPLYGEIQSMKKNLNRLVDEEMQKVVEHLVKAQQGPKASREQAFKDARSTIREVVLKLSIERQNLLRRLKTAEIVAQVRRLIQLESTCMAATLKLPEQAPAQREKKALATIEDQRDVRQLYLQLEDVLRDVSRWGGAMGTGATEGLKKLQEAAVRKELDVAGRNLEATLFADASANQENVIAGLRQLLERLEHVQGLLNTERQQALDSVRDLARRQEQLREQTRKADLANEAVLEPLVKEQASIRKDLAKLDAAAQTPEAKALLDQAKEAAHETTKKLFDGRQEEAVIEQGKVLGNLAELQNQLQADNVSEEDKSADEYARLVSELERARDEVIQLQARQDQAARAQPDVAAQQEQRLATETAKVSDNRDLPKPVDAALVTAESALKEAAEELGQPAGDEARKQMQAKAVERASETLERARAEIETALADARRKELAVEIGELARASESLERAASAEREIARAADAAGREEGLSTEQAANLRREQAEIDAVARKVAEGTGKTAPEVATLLLQASDETKAVEQQLQAAEQRPGEASKPAAMQAADQARQAASKLEQAAAELRRQFGNSAEELAREATSQKQPVAAAREAVEAALKTEAEPLSQRRASLEAAREQVRQAEQSQLKASGQPEAAAAMEMAHEIAKTRDQQAAADRAARELAGGQTESPLNAAQAEQTVADRAKEIAQQAGKRPQAKQAKSEGKPDPIANALEQARQAAMESAKFMAEGDLPKADAARNQARAALEQAQAAANIEAAAAKDAPAGKPDPGAQENVARQAAAAQNLAQADAPDAAQSLQQAQQAASDAAKNLAADKPAAVSQKTSAEKLAQASHRLAEAMQQLSREAQRQLASKSRGTEKLAEQASKVDAPANAALQQAENIAEQADAPSGDPEATMLAEAAADQALERAAANLQAREERLERDREIAEAIAALAKQQEKAAKEISEKRQELSVPVEAPPASAEALAGAQQEFAEAQRATGQGAQQVSGQEQVANLPIREALEIASRLGRAEPMPANDPPAPMPGEPSPAPPGDLATPMPGTPMPGQAGAPSESGEPAAGTELGSEFVPNSPEVTAEMMAGPEAQAVVKALVPKGSGPPMDKALAKGRGESKSPKSRSKEPKPGSATSESEKPEPGKTSSRASARSSREGNREENEKVKAGQVESADEQQQNDSRTATEKRDSDAAALAFEKETWFARLPPELRQAMRARAQRRAPRAYEERLRRYFESLD